ncbi:hypothetical protein CANINC_002239 [Pichia inconspicua]|uniref:Retrograde transport protein Dsl1 C-terminal domain-containing protein n=1 Tax=Pichia inconspicua TaxID=52247 RepID=A0A4T0X1U2_9ASCO|nr:hypothetical protein CANINC_002239 [[Candida] inconspicua]
MTSAVEEHDRIIDINTKLTLIDSGLNSYFQNYNLQQLEHVLNKVDELKDNHAGVHQKFDNCKSRDINELMEFCNQLLIIKLLISQSAEKMTLFEELDKFEKLETKFSELKNSIDDTVKISELKIIDDLDRKIHEDKKNLMKKSQEYLERYILVTEEEFVIFDEVESQPFSSTLQTINRFYGETFNEAMDLTKRFQEWVETALSDFDRGKSVTFEDGTDKKRLRIVDSDVEFSEFAKSIKQIIFFMNQVTKYTENVKSLANIRPIVGKQLLKEIRSRIFSKDNVYPLIIDKLNYEEGSEVSDISKLYEISNLLAEPGWAKDGICELEFWIDDLTSFWVNNLIDLTIDDIKQFVRDFLAGKYENRLINQNLVVVEFFTEEKHDEKVSKESNTEWENNWEEKDGWNEDDDASLMKNEPLDDSIDDDGWGEDHDLDLDLDLDLDDEVKEDDEDGWDAWNEEVSISDNDTENKKEAMTNKQKAPLVPSYKHTTLVKNVFALLVKYFNNFDELRKFDVDQEQLADIEDLFKQGLKKLCMAYFMMIQSNVSHTYNNQILFCNDYSKLLEDCSLSYGVDLKSCYKLNSNFLQEYINDHTEKLISVISNFSSSIWGDNVLTNNEINEESFRFMNEFDSHLDEVLQEVETSTQLNTQLVANLVVTMIFKTFNVICNKLVSRNSISSYESSILNEIIDHIIQEVKSRLAKLNVSTGNIQSLVKLEQIQLILSSNLKEILGAFYDAKFYELETFELTSLIKSLFVDSMQRDQIIQEITILREET